MRITTEEILANWHTHSALWLIEDPQFLKKHRFLLVEAVGKSTDAHVEFLVDMSRSAETIILQAVARNPCTPVEILPSFLTDPYSVDQLLWNPASPSELIEKAFYAIRKKRLFSPMIFDHDESNCLAVSQNPNSGAKTLDYAIRLARDACTMVNLVDHPNTPRETLEWVLTRPRRQNHEAIEAARKKLEAMGAPCTPSN